MDTRHSAYCWAKRAKRVSLWQFIELRTLSQIPTQAGLVLLASVTNTPVPITR